MKSQIINHEKQRYFVCFTCIIASHIFVPRKENGMSYISVPKMSIYLFTHFYFFCFISTQFADYAFLKMQMQVTLENLFNVLNNVIWSML